MASLFRCHCHHYHPVIDFRVLVVGTPASDSGLSTFGPSLECVRACVRALVLVGNLASDSVSIFSHLIYLIKKCYECCTPSAIYKDRQMLQ